MHACSSLLYRPLACLYKRNRLIVASVLLLAFLTIQRERVVVMNHKHSLSSDSRSSSSSSINSDDGASKEVRIAVVGQGGVGKSGMQPSLAV